MQGAGAGGADPIWGPPSCLPRPGQRRLSTQLRGGAGAGQQLSVRPPSSGPTQLYAPRSRAPGAQPLSFTLVGDTDPSCLEPWPSVGLALGQGQFLLKTRAPSDTGPRRLGRKQPAPALSAEPAHCLSFHTALPSTSPLKRSHPTLEPTRSLLTLLGGCPPSPRPRPWPPRPLGPLSSAWQPAHPRRWPRGATWAPWGRLSTSPASSPRKPGPHSGRDSVLSPAWRASS